MNNKEDPVDVVRQVQVQVASTGAIRETEGMRWSAIVEEAPAAGGGVAAVDVLRLMVSAAGGGGKADPAVGGGDGVVAAWKAMGQ